jgi:hypothetical protein
LEKTLSSLYGAALSVLFLAVLVAALVRYYSRGRRAADATWDQLLQRLTFIDRDAIATVALDALTESGEPRPQGDSFELDPGVIWTLLGGLEGLEIMERNCAVFVELAAYIQRSYPEALIVAEQLRLNAREIEWHVKRLQGAAQTGNLHASFAAYAQRAVVTYYIMSRNLLALYGSAGFSRLAELQQAI